jgi:hypothetical protein
MLFKWERDPDYGDINLYSKDPNRIMGWVEQRTDNTYRVKLLGSINMLCEEAQYVTLRGAMRDARRGALLLIIGGHYGV